MTTENTAKAKNKFPLVPIILGIVILIAGLIGLVYYLTHTEQINPSFVYELGDSLDTELTHYVKGSSFAIKEGVLNLDNVDTYVAGTYSASVDIKKKHYEYEVLIQDTIAPKINVNPTPEINVGITYTASDFYNGATDLSGDVETHFYLDGQEQKEFLFTQIGQHNVLITAKDINDNHSEVSIDFNAIDTIAPVITPLADYGYYATGRIYDINSFILEVTDNSTDYSFVSRLNGTETQEFTFGDCGTYDIEVIATDGAGNTSSYSVTINADDPPILYGLPTDMTAPILFTSDTEVNFYEGLIAWDNEAGFITDMITCAETTTDVGADGTSPAYLVTLQVSDEHDLTTEVQLRFEQVSKKKYSDTERDYPDELITRMLEADAFNYELLTEPDKEALKKLIWPCEISINLGNSRCSGFIYKIDEDYIYIATSGHCIKSKKRYADFTLIIYNPTTSTMVQNKSYQLELTNRKVVDIEYTKNSSEDIALIKLSRDQIPNKYLVHLKEVNKTNESNPKYDQGIYTYAMYVKKGYITNIFEKKYTLFNKHDNPNYQVLLEKFTAYNNKDKWLLTNEVSVSGQSGSAIFDNYGNPIAITTGELYRRYGTDTYTYGFHRKISGLKALFEKLSQS